MNLLKKGYDAAFKFLIHIDILINQGLDYIEDEWRKRRVHK